MRLKRELKKRPSEMTMAELVDEVIVLRGEAMTLRRTLADYRRHRAHVKRALDLVMVDRSEASARLLFSAIERPIAEAPSAAEECAIGEMDDRFLYESDVKKLTGISRTTRWREIKMGRFPAPIRLSAGRKAWRESDIRNWRASLSEADKSHLRTYRSRAALKGGVDPEFDE